MFQTPPDETRDAVTAALAAGYRHIDTAAAYGNERQVGEAIAASGVDRSDVFVETKIWISDYGYDQTLHGFEKSARKLGVDQIDLLILHQALPGEFDQTLEAYRALETLLADGKVRAIGVSNFMVDHLDRAAGEGHGGAGGQPDRGPPLLPAARGAGRGRATTASSPRPGHRSAASPSTATEAHQHPAGPGRSAASPRPHGKTPGAGDAALAPAAGPLGDPEVDQAGPDRGEPRRLRLRPHRRRAGRDRRPRHRPARRPRTDAITLEAFGRPIPES